MQEIVNWILGLGTNWPDLTSLIVGSGAGFLLTLALERYFLPVALDPEVKRHQQGLTFIFCWLTSTAASVLMWGAIDGHDPLAMRMAVSSVVSVAGFFGYPALARAMTARWPMLGSAWESTKDDRP